MRCVFQILRRQTGERSPAAEGLRSDFATVLDQALREHPEAIAVDDFVIVVIDNIREPSASVSLAPVMTVERFLREFLPARSSDNG